MQLNPEQYTPHHITTVVYSQVESFKFAVTEKKQCVHRRRAASASFSRIETYSDARPSCNAITSQISISHRRIHCTPCSIKAISAPVVALANRFGSSFPSPSRQLPVKLAPRATNVPRGQGALTENLIIIPITPSWTMSCRQWASVLGEMRNR
jgi:hypothetical protein